MEETAKEWRVGREAQNAWAFEHRRRVVAGWSSGFFDDLAVRLPELERDADPRAGTSAERRATLESAFDKRPKKQTLTAGTSSPVTDEAACVDGGRGTVVLLGRV